MTTSTPSTRIAARAPASLHELATTRTWYEESVGWPVHADASSRCLTLLAGQVLDAVSLPEPLAVRAQTELRVMMLAGPVIAEQGGTRWVMLTDLAPSAEARLPMTSPRRARPLSRAVIASPCRLSALVPATTATNGLFRHRVVVRCRRGPRLSAPPDGPTPYETRGGTKSDHRCQGCCSISSCFGRCARCHAARSAPPARRERCAIELTISPSGCSALCTCCVETATSTSRQGIKTRVTDGFLLTSRPKDMNCSASGTPNSRRQTPPRLRVEIADSDPRTCQEAFL